MSIGLEFIGEIDKGSKNFQSALFKEEDEQIDKIFTSKEPNDYNYLNFEDENSDWDYWAFWKKKYSILR